MNHKQRLKRFRQWQQEPFSYTRDTATHKCNNCGEEFEGNYCPTCSQRAGMGRITWNSVWLGFLELWGMHTRSMPYSLWQLLLRPGYFIADYISGRRQVSFPPVKMLVIIGLIVLIANNLLDPENTVQMMENVKIDGKGGQNAQDFVLDVLKWFSKHYDWGFLLLQSFLIWPTWVLFRISPRCDHHTLPEGFFIQVFNSVQMLLLLLVAIIINKTETDMLRGLGAYFFIVVMVIQFYRSYKQLFGHSVWGTIWRLIVVVAVGILLMIMALLFFVCIVVAFVPTETSTPDVSSIHYIFGALTLPLPFLIVIFIIFGISLACIKYQLKKDAKKQREQENTEKEAEQEIAGNASVIDKTSTNQVNDENKAEDSELPQVAE